MSACDPAADRGRAADSIDDSLIAREIRDVVLVTIDTWRHDAGGFTDADRVETPRLDALAGEAMVFERAYAHAVVTLPSHASLLTGRLPYQHGIRDNAGFTLPESERTLAHMLSENGFETGAFVSAFPLDRRYGLDRAFDVYDDARASQSAIALTMPERDARETVSRALNWWKRPRDSKPRFMWVHVFTPHFPYEPEPKFREAYAEEPYFGEVATVDDQLAPLFDELTREDDGRDAPLVIVTSDHGESLGEHGEATHGVFAYDATLRVPLMIWARGLIQPGRTRMLARHVDVVPTVFDVLGLPVETQKLPGNSLFDEFQGDYRTSYFEAMSPSINRGWAPLTGRIEGRLKAIDLPDAELYDLLSDAEELENLAPEQRKVWRQIVRAMPAERLETSARSELDEDQIEALESLGYVARNADTVNRLSGTASDPKNLIRFDQDLQDALTDYRRGRVEDSIAKFNTLIEKQPLMNVAYSHLAFIYTDIGRIDRALEVLDRAAAAGAQSESLARRHALLLARSGRSDRALQLLTVYRDSNDPETRVTLGRVQLLAGEIDRARSTLGDVLEEDPSNPAALMDLGILELTVGNVVQAERNLSDAVSENPSLAEAWTALGVIRSQAGDREAAIEAWNRAIQADPRNTDALYNLALTLAGAERFAEAANRMTEYLRWAPIPPQERARVSALIDSWKTPAR